MNSFRGECRQYNGFRLPEMINIDWTDMDLIPAMVLHGVKTRETIALRILNVPGFVAGKMANTVRGGEVSLEALDQWLNETDIRIWQGSLPAGAKITGSGCKHLWEIMEGKKSWKSITHSV